MIVTTSRDIDSTVDPRLSEPHIINVVCYLNHLHVIQTFHLSEQIFKARGHRGSDKRGSTVVQILIK